MESDGTVAEDTAGGDPWDIEYPEADWGEDDHLPATPKGDSAVARCCAMFGARGTDASTSSATRVVGRPPGAHNLRGAVI